MSLDKHREQLFWMAIKDHEIFAKATEHYRSMFGGEPLHTKTKDVEALQRLFGQTLKAHFTFEEQQVFPVLLADNPDAKVSQIVAQLGAEHQPLLEQTGQLHTMLSRPDLDGIATELQNAMQEFFTSLDSHTEIEDELYLRGFGDLSASMHP